MTKHSTDDKQHFSVNLEVCSQWIDAYFCSLKESCKNLQRLFEFSCRSSESQWCVITFKAPKVIKCETVFQLCPKVRPLNSSLIVALCHFFFFFPFCNQTCSYQLCYRNLGSFDIQQLYFCLKCYRDKVLHSALLEGLVRMNSTGSEKNSTMSQPEKMVHVLQSIIWFSF